MRHLMILALIAVTSYVNGQDGISAKRIPVDKIFDFIDSLRIKIIDDTTKFDRKDLIHSNGGTRNTNPYSSLFIVDMKYQYLLDIVNGQEVTEFINEFLDTKKIAGVEKYNFDESKITIGSKGVNGVIYIQIKKGVKRRYDVAGLKLEDKKESLDNFDQRKNGELIILR